MTKILCKKTHIQFKDGKLDIDNEETRQTMLDIVEQLKKAIRVEIHNEIASLNFTENRKNIVKHGIENVALQVQDICAKVALGDHNASL